MPSGSPYDKDYSILGSILRSPYFGKLPYRDIMEKKMETTIMGLYRVLG